MRRDLRRWDEDIQKINDKREAYHKYLSTKTEEDKIMYHKKRAIAKKEGKNTDEPGMNMYLCWKMILQDPNHKLTNSLKNLIVK